MNSLRKRIFVGNFTMISLLIPLVIVVITTPIATHLIFGGLALVGTSAMYAFLLHQLNQPLTIKFGRDGFIK